VAHDNGLIALAAATRGCSVAELDAVNGKHSAVLVAPSGRSLRLSSGAATLVHLARAGESAEMIAARFGASSEALDRAADELAARIANALGAAAGGMPGFLAHRTLVSGARATRWASRMTWLFDRAVGPAVALAALAIVIVAHRADPGTQLPTYALWAGFALSIAIMFVHELGHAAACRSFGASVGAIGCAIYLVYPALYCDVTHTWSLSRRERLTVDIGGVYFQLIGTAVVALFWWATGSPVLLAAIRVSLATLAVNLMPIGRFDGYWVLSDALGIIDLRAQQRRVVAAAWSRLSRQPGEPLPWPWWTTAAIASYGAATAWFVSAILFRFLPNILVELWRLPDRIAELSNADSVAATATPLGQIVSSIIVAVIAAVLVQNLARSAIGLARRTVRHVRQAPAPRTSRSE